MARGVVPTTARELVSEVGAHYAPELAVPKGRALGYSVDLERGALPPGGGQVHLRVALRSTDAQQRTRPRLSVHVVLDTSGSMAGEPLYRAKEAAEHLIEQLAPEDEFSLTAFADNARVIVPTGFIGPRRAAIREAIEATQSSGSTNIGEALTTAYEQAGRRTAASDVVPVVMLLSDGQPTAGIHDRTQLSFLALQAFQAGIQTSTFGLGTQFDATLMSGIASDGAGGYYYLRAADQIAEAFRSELHQRLDPAAAGVEVRVRLASDVSLLGVYGSRRLDERETAVERAKEVATDVQAQHRAGIRRDRQEDVKGGMRFFIPAFGRNDAYSLLLKVSVPPGSTARSLGTFELRYKDLVHGTNVGEESPIGVRFAKSDAESVATADGSVARTIQGHLAGEDLLAASRFVGAGQVGSAIELLRERQQILVNAATSLGEPGLQQDASRFSRLLGVLRGEEELGEPLAVAMVLETAARSHLQ
jgi:Mg-chelatase subunit ChlD